jgi:3-methyladenine DNA glycosylase AlkC
VPALKDMVDAALVRALAAELVAAWPPFPVDRFVERTVDGLAPLELKGRLRHIADGLQHVLPEPPGQVVAVLDEALRSPTFDGWMVWPVAELIGRIGPSDPNTVVPFMARLTGRSSCEFAIRPCLEQHRELTHAQLQRWVDHPDEHVRRLVSEGTRPRLPWGARLTALQADPAPSIALLDRLRDDPSAYVRRSVANHLGDIVKDHPELALAVAQRWRAEGGDHVDEVVRHGLRTLIKAGDPQALGLIGYDTDAPVVLRAFAVDPEQLAIGQRTTLTAALESDGDQPVPVVVEYLIHYLGVRGPRKAKAYRWAERVLQPGEVCELTRRQRFAHASIRRLEPGEQVVEVQVNGRVLGRRTLHLTP